MMTDDDWELTSSTSLDTRTLVLFGKTGNGKSATGNSILGRKVFKSEIRLSGVTSTCEMKSTKLRDGRTINVIDTPGLFDTVGNNVIVKEIVKCIDLAKDGIHAILLVFSTRSRFSQDEEATVESLKILFGEKILDHMVVVITGGDDLEDMTLGDYIHHECPEPFKKILKLCKYRVTLFDNKTKDGNQQAQQLHELLSIVDSVVADNGGQPFSDQFFSELKERASRLYDKEREIESLKGHTKEQIAELKEQFFKSYDDQLARITLMLEEKLKQSVERLEKQLAEEKIALQEAQMRSNEEMREFREKSNEEIRKLREVGCRNA